MIELSGTSHYACVPQEHGSVVLALDLRRTSTVQLDNGIEADSSFEGRIVGGI